jgi:RNA recognition motif-containing protein
MRDPTGRSRGFGFLTFTSPSDADESLKVEHWIDGKLVDAKKAGRGPAQGGQEGRSEKIFVGGVHPDVEEPEFREYFGTFGTVRLFEPKARTKKKLMMWFPGRGRNADVRSRDGETEGVWVYYV